MATYHTGRAAELSASEYLQHHDYRIIARNWRTRYCEIDIVAMKNGTLYFIEVKHRSSSRQGTGLDYITPKKLDQMRFAAELWVVNHHWLGPTELAAIAVSGSNYEVTDLVVI